MAHHPVHLFVFDVDGTLLNSRLEIPVGTRRAVRRLRDEGHRVAVASARPPKSVAEISEDLLGSVSEAISLNGALVSQGDTFLLEEDIAPDDATALIERARASGLEINLYAHWDWLVERIGPGVQAEAEIVGFDPTLVDDVLAEARRAAHKILVIGPEPDVRDFQSWISGSELYVEATLSKPTYCEVVVKEVSKSGAMVFLADRIGVPIQRVVAFGDGENDLPMIVAAGTGVAMGNAMAAVKEAADLVTESHDADGIEKALVELGFVAGG